MASTDPSRPNFVVIVTDAQGPWALGCQGNTELQTPTIDALAGGGVRFESILCASPVCWPARASLLTGRMPSAHGVHDWIRGEAYGLRTKRSNAPICRMEAARSGYRRTTSQRTSSDGGVRGSAGRTDVSQSGTSTRAGTAMSADSRPAPSGASVQQSPPRMSGSAAFQRAKDLLAAWFGLTPGEAENLLLTWSCENKVSACELATALVNDIHQADRAVAAQRSCATSKPGCAKSRRWRDQLLIPPGRSRNPMSTPACRRPIPAHRTANPPRTRSRTRSRASIRTRICPIDPTPTRSANGQA
jgi:hypothetical protein